MITRSILDHTVNTANGTPVALSIYRGRITLCTNIASMCAFASSQMPQLQTLEHNFSSGGRFTVLAFPCSQFAMQEPKRSCDIPLWGQTVYGVTFPIFEKIHVRGPTAHPLFVTLAEGTREQGGPPQWNFCKYLCSTSGIPMKRYDHTTPPSVIMHDIKNMMDGH